ncbi:MAG: hypothetical protein Q8N09_06035 [Thermodesulfovibrionia bacterium]|nr:hypothetical protein [Thermodesulfovibrionia bacterium]
MRKMILVLVAVGLFGFAAVDLADAADTADITVTVTVRTLALTLSANTWPIGLVDVNYEAVRSAAIAVTNTGNASQTYQLKLVDPAAWLAVLTDAGMATAERYQLGAIFQTTATAAPVAVDYVDSADFVSTTYVSCTATVFAKTTGNGLNVAATEARDLWLHFRAPSSTTATAGQSIVVTVKAIAGV